MIPARVLTLCVGISAYPAAMLTLSEQPLRFLAASARELSDLFRVAWSGADSRHWSAIDDEATLARVTSLLAAERNEYDLFILYLGGHGRNAGGSFQFVFFDEVVPSAAIDTLASRARSKNVLLLLDACHSGQFLATTKFFRMASPHEVRICIASSRAEQKSWEDEHFGNSLFADALSRAFTSGGAPSKRLGSQLFPEVADEVARHAFALKRSTAQEPDLLGDDPDAVSVPIIAARGTRAPSISTYRTLLRRTRQVATGAVTLGVVAIVLTSAVTWRPAINGTGWVELRAGPKWLSPLNVGPWRRRVELDLTRADLKGVPIAGAIESELLNEEGVRLWPGQNAAGVRRWSDVFVERYLDTGSAQRWHVRLGYPGAVERLTGTIAPGGGGGVRVPSVAPRRVTAVAIAGELVAEGLILDPAQGVSDAWDIEWQQHVVPGNCIGNPLSQNAVDRIDIYLNPSETEKFVRWLQGLVARAHVDDSMGFENVVMLIEMFTSAHAQWREQRAALIANAEEPFDVRRLTARFFERPSLAEMRELGNVAATILRRRASASRDLVTAAERARLDEALEGCIDVAARVLAPLGHHGGPEAIIAWAHGRPRGDQGRIALRDLAQAAVLPDSEVTWLLDTVGFAGNQVDRKRAFLNAGEWLTSLSDVMPLSQNVLTQIVDYAWERFERQDLDGAREALLVVAHNAQSLTGALKATADDLAAKLATGVHPSLVTPFELEWLGLLARAGVQLSAEQRHVLTRVLGDVDEGDVPKVVFTENDKTGTAEVTQLVAGVSTSQLIAYARLVSGSTPSITEADSREIRFLEQALADAFRFGVPVRRMQDVIEAAATLRVRGQQVTQTAIRERLRAASGNAAIRRAAVEVDKTAILMLPRNARAQLIEEMRAAWRREREPDVKLALAEIVIRAVLEPKQRP